MNCRHWKKWSPFFLIMTLALQGAAWAGSTTTVNITSSGQTREFISYVPSSYDPATPTPLLFMMHGLLSSAASAAAPNGPYRWQTLADQEGFIVLFPNSYQDDSWDMNQADANFVRDMIDWSIKNYNIRTSHIFTTGHSMGGFFSYYIAVQLRNDLHPVAAFAEHSGGLFFNLWPTPVPFDSSDLAGLLIHSSGDSVVPYSASEALHNRLLAADHTSQLITLPANRDHNWDRSLNETQWDFFLANAQPDRTPEVPLFSGGFQLMLACTILCSSFWFFSRNRSHQLKQSSTI